MDLNNSRATINCTSSSSTSRLVVVPTSRILELQLVYRTTTTSTTSTASTSTARVLVVLVVVVVGTATMIFEKDF